MNLGSSRRNSYPNYPDDAGCVGGQETKKQQKTGALVFGVDYMVRTSDASMVPLKLIL